MNPLAKVALATYCRLTTRQRRASLAELCNEGRAPVCGLFYHRVANDTPNGWTISESRFARQIDWLASRFDVVSLAEARRRIVEHDSPRPSVVITFDDGYADNMHFAAPLLVERGLPFTYFVTTRHIADQTPFPHDVAANAPLKPNTVSDLRWLADRGVEVAAHTLSHADLGVANPADLRSEIEGSIRQVEDWVGRGVSSFAFPFGLPANMTPLGMRIARDAGAEVICSAYGGYNLPGDVMEIDGAVHFRRIHADPEWSRFVNWMTFDPRKLAQPDPICDVDWLQTAPIETPLVGAAG